MKRRIKLKRIKRSLMKTLGLKTQKQYRFYMRLFTDMSFDFLAESRREWFDITRKNRQAWFEIQRDNRRKFDVYISSPTAYFLWIGRSWLCLILSCTIFPYKLRYELLASVMVLAMPKTSLAGWADPGSLPIPSQGAQWPTAIRLSKTFGTHTKTSRHSTLSMMKCRIMCIV